MNKKTIMSMSVALAALGLLISASAKNVLADEHRYTATDPVWKEECGSCHIAYPPRLLPATTWREMMSGLNKHFGTDASLDAKTAQHISSFLERNAGRERASRKSSTLRITDTRWFVHEHDEVPNGVWANPEVKTASNCQACHTGAAAGDFDEDSIRLPR